MSSSSNPTPPPVSPSLDPTPSLVPPPMSPSPDPTASLVSPSPDPTPLPRPLNPALTPPSKTPSLDTALPPKVPNTTPTPLPGASNPTSTPLSKVPSSDAALSPGTLNTSPTQQLGAPIPTPKPPSRKLSLDATLSPGAPNTTPTLQPGTLNPTPTPSFGIPSFDATLPPETPNTASTSPPEAPNPSPIPTSRVPSSDAALLLRAPNSALTPSSDPILPPEAPNTTPTLSPGTPSSGPTPSSEAPNTTPTLPSGVPNSDPALSPGAQITPPTPTSEAPNSNQEPSSDQAPNTTPTPPSGAPISDAAPPPEGPNTAPIPSSEAPNFDQAPPPKTTSPDATSAPSSAPSSVPEHPDELTLEELKEKVLRAFKTREAGQTTTIVLHGETGVGKTWLAREISKVISHIMHVSEGETDFGGTLCLSVNKKYHGIDATTRSRLILEDIARQLCVLPPTEGGFEDGDHVPDPDDILNKKVTKRVEEKMAEKEKKEEEKGKFKKEEEKGKSKKEKGMSKGEEEEKDKSKKEKEKGKFFVLKGKFKHKEEKGKFKQEEEKGMSKEEEEEKGISKGEEEEKDKSKKEKEKGKFFVLKGKFKHKEEKGKFKQEEEKGMSKEEEEEKGMSKEEEEKGKFFVLTVDGAHEHMDVEAEIIKKVQPLMEMRMKGLLRVILLVTTKRSSGTSTSTESGTMKDDDKIVNFPIKPLKKNDNLKLLQSSAGEIHVSEKFKDYFSVPLPAAVAVVVGKALKHNFSQPGCGHDDDQDEVLEKALKEAAKEKEIENIGTLLVRYAFDTLPSSDATMIKCCWHSRKFFEAIDNGSVHYNELISHWIMEGYLDDVKHSGIEKAYEEGYRILVELKKRGLLKVEDEDFVAMEGVALKVPDHRREGFDETAMLGLPDVFRDNQDWQGLGKIAVADGMIKSVCWPRKWENVSTLMIDGTRLCREVPNTFFKPMKELRVLVLLKPRLTSLDFIGGGEGEAYQLSNLRLLVLRGCNVLENIDPIKELKSLVVLEISGAKSLQEIPDDLFAKMSELRSLNLSGSQVKSLPSSFSILTKLRWLILRGCSNLERMPSLKAFEDLEVLDMFGSCSLTKFRDKKFGNLTKLRVVDFSQAKIAPLPFVNPLVGLVRLTLKDCTEITRLPHLDKLHGLKFLELPGATKFKEFYHPYFTNKEALRIFDLSKTPLCRLPSTVKDLPGIEVLNLSHMSFLEDLEGLSFSKYSCIQSLNLSNTNVKSLPSLSDLKSLRQLLLNDCPCLEALPEIKELTSLEILDLSRASELKEMSDHVLELKKLRQLLLPDCKKLKKLPILKDLQKLELLDLSGCEALIELEKQSFQEMSALQELDLSATKVQSVPYLPTSTKFRRLLLEKCTELGEISALNSLPKDLEELNLCGIRSPQILEAKSSPLKIECESLQTLNLSGTSMVLSSDFTKLTNLKNLSLKGCLFSKKPQLKELLKLEVLDLSDTKLVERESLKKCSNLEELINSGKALSLKELSGDLKSLLKLNILHLWGLEVQEFPYWISDLVHLKSLSLPNLASIKQLEWGQKIKRLPDHVNWEECGIFKNASIHQASDRPSTSMSIANLQLLRQQSEIWKKCFCTFHIYVCPPNESGKDEDIYRLRDESFFEEIYFKTICCPESCKRFLEIRGFKERPDGLEKALSEGENLPDCVSFIEDDFITSLSDIGAKNLQAVTGLWLERCVKTEFIFSAENAIELGEHFNLLWASNLPVLKSLSKGNVQDQCFSNLTQLYLDCCPMLEHVFSSSQLPEKLVELQVKFCDKLKTLLKSESSSKEEHELPNLNKLILLELPELTTVGFKLPSLRKAEVKGCPKLKKEEFIVGLGLKNKAVEVTNVRENWETGSEMETEKYFTSEK